MSKRAPQFEKRPRGFYPTPYEAVAPLLPHLAEGTKYYEPCVGDGALVRHLSEHGHVCVGQSDIEVDATAAAYSTPADCFLTNPNWSRDVLHPIIVNLSDQLPTWLLFDADWIHTKQAIPYLPRLRKVVSVGRVKWIPGSPFTGKDNCAWHLFDTPKAGAAEIYGRAA